jgi:GAF domain-containing protein
MSSKGMLCRASIGSGGPPLGTRVDANSGFSGECVRTGKSLRCDDSETDPRVVAEICRKLGIRSIAAAPIRYERDVVGLLEVFSPNSFAFDEGDLAVLERLAQTAILLMSQTQSRKAATAAAQH